MEAYRLAREKYATPLSGIGAALYGARWNSIGKELIYLASNRSLAMAEVAVHLTLGTLPQDYMMVSVFIPDNISLQKISPTELPAGWNAFPHPVSTQYTGDNFVMESLYCVLQVPSAVTSGDYNLLINPLHPEFKRILITEVSKFPFDKRIFE
ncbi:RES family NAD+ phosphorylase [Filimonas effusa]|uniref:RES domain-containing protein n=1 Tax=Filimonas effusa TaxID=2508721 RepID=A0A4Q1D4D1_9BACT|nr:RES family NAD+ phosphorylase [Filimonas effusa]RXK82786.1 RES domain-containing protein [Filimonas effusa]